MSGYFLIARQLFESSIWTQSSDIIRLFIYLLGKARYMTEPKKYVGFEVKRGEVLTSLAIISDDNKCAIRGYKPWPRETVRRHLKVLEDLGIISFNCDTYGTHIKIINYSTYQDPSKYQCDTDVTMVRQSCDNGETIVGTIERKINKDNKEKKDKNKGPTLEEIFSIELPNPINSKEHIDAWRNYLEYKQSSKKPYASLKSAQMVISRWSKRPSEFVEVCEQAIAGQWDGLYWNKSYSSTQLTISNQNRAPIAILGPNGAISGDINFNTLPFNAKKDIYAAAKDKMLDKICEEADRKREEEASLKLLMEKQHETNGNKESINKIIFDISQQRAITNRH